MTVETSAVTEERDWIARASKGDTKAFTALVQRHEERAIRTAYSLLGNWEDARDISQEAFVKAYSGLKKFKGESQFFTWFYRILVNQCKDYMRKKKVRGHLAIFIGSPSDEEGLNPTERVAAPSDVRSEVLNKELQGEIYQAMEELPFQQRQAFVLRYLESRSLLEIAELMDLSPGAVKAHLWQAGQKMKKKLAKYLSG